jgi:ribonuclease Z
METRVTFLGTSTAVPEPAHDTASFIINGNILVDMGWNATLRMGQFGVDPLDIEYLILTHCHHDHYLSLPALLFYRMMMGQRRDGGLKPLRVIGPAADVARVVSLALGFLQAERFQLDAQVTVLPLGPGESLEQPGFRLDTVPSIHPVQGMSYRFTDHQTGARLCFTGDTAFNPAVAELARGCPVLIHEAALGPVAGDPANNPALHSGALDAARIAEMAGVGQLYLVHALAAQMPECLAAARVIFPAVDCPSDGQSVVIPAQRV